MANPKGGGEEDDGDSYQKQVEAKESANMARYSKAKLAFEKAKPTASEESARMADSAKRPAKDVPMEEPAGILRTTHGMPTSITAQATDDDDSDGEGEGDGSQGKSGGGSGGGPSPDLDLDSSDYTPFADAVDTKANKAEQRAEARRTAEQEKSETADIKGQETTTKASAPTPIGQKTGAPSGPSATKTGGGSSGPSSSGTGAKGGGTAGPVTGPG